MRHALRTMPGLGNVVGSPFERPDTSDEWSFRRPEVVSRYFLSRPAKPQRILREPVLQAQHCRFAALVFAAPAFTGPVFTARALTALVLLPSSVLSVPKACYTTDGIHIGCADM